MDDPTLTGRSASEMNDAVGLFDFRQRKANKLTARGYQLLRDAEYEKED